MAAEYVFIWNVLAPQHVYQAFTRHDATLSFHQLSQDLKQDRCLDRESLVARLPEPVEEQPLKIAAAERITMADLEALFRLLEEAGYRDILLLTEPGQ